MNRLDWTSQRGRPLRGEVRIPGDKSVSHRALMLSAIAEGTTRIRGFLEGEDTRATAAVLAQLGVRIEAPSPGERVVHGVGLHGLRGSSQALDCGNAGTGMRLLAGLLAGQAFDSTLVGDESLSRRPMRRVTDPLTRMGAQVDSRDGLPPLVMRGGQALHGIRYELPVASAQVKSALLLAGLYAVGETEIIEPHPTRDYTERMLAAFGWPIRFSPGHAVLEGGHALCATDVDVPADFSSAAFFLVAASVVPGSELRLPAVGLNPRRTGLLHALRLMGADIVVENERSAGGEPVGDLVVRHAPLHGIELPGALVPDMIDEFPALFIAAAVASGRTVVRGAAELRVKE
ncbi:MAG: 3-phosphoshikimate 1-carboxyvinyltransferase, partial [Rhodanobacter sp.]